MGDPSDAADLLQTGYDRWKEAGLDISEFRNAQLRFSDGSMSTARYYLKERTMDYGHVRIG